MEMLLQVVEKQSPGPGGGTRCEDGEVINKVLKHQRTCSVFLSAAPVGIAAACGRGI